MYIQEVILVEGKSDIAAVRKAVHAIVLKTGGRSEKCLSPTSIHTLVAQRGLCLFTDPDGPGEKIRSFYQSIFPTALNAHIPAKFCRHGKHIGIAYAKVQDIQQALINAGCHLLSNEVILTKDDMYELGLIGLPQSKSLRLFLADYFQIPYANGKQFQKLLSALQVSKKDLHILLNHKELYS